MYLHDYKDYARLNKIMIHETGVFVFLEKDELNIKNSLERSTDNDAMAAELVDGEYVNVILYEHKSEFVKKYCWYGLSLCLFHAGTLYDPHKSDVFILGN